MRSFGSDLIPAYTTNLVLKVHDYVFLSLSLSLGFACSKEGVIFECIYKQILL